MKLRVISTALLFLAAGVALAQQPPEEFERERLERLTTLLDLDEAQKEAVQKVLDEERAQMQTFRQQMKTAQERPTREQMQAQREQMQKETTEKMRGILSDTQMTKYEALADRPMGPGARQRMKPDSADQT